MVVYETFGAFCISLEKIITLSDDWAYDRNSLGEKYF